MMTLTDKEFLRYHRHVMVEKIGESGQAKFKQARIAIVGLGGLGCPASQYLTASGVGNLVLIDPDCIELSNLQRQVLYREQDIGQPKVQAAKARLKALNAKTEISTIEESVFDIDFYDVLQQVDLVLDCTDSAKTRKFVNQLCFETKTPLVSASAIQGSVQLVSFDYATDDAPCYECLFPVQGEQVLNCSTAGVFSPVLGVMGSLQATEALRILLGQTDNLHKLSLFDAWGVMFQKFNVKKDPACPCCSN
mgnify:CR=1 FL=1